MREAARRLNNFCITPTERLVPEIVRILAIIARLENSDTNTTTSFLDVLDGWYVNLKSDDVMWIDSHLEEHHMNLSTSRLS